MADYRAYYGGLKIRTTIDLPMQQAAEQAISQELPTGPGEPSASLVAIDNKTGQVRAMVGGPLVGGQEDFNKFPFNLATEGLRQPGSAFKPFTLAVALQRGFGPDSVIDSKPLNLIVPNSRGKEHFIVHNFNNAYSGPITLANATAESDNSVFTQVGLAVGTKRVAKMATNMGIRTPVSTNYAMIIGGLKVGVSPLDMAHAYETLAENGRRVYDPKLGAPEHGPTGIAQIQCPHISCNGKRDLVDHPHFQRVIPVSVAQTIHQLLVGVVQHGTGTSAQISGVDVAGKTGTTSNYGDAWFVGWTPQITTAVWVGFPNKLIPMTTLYNGGPVEGGTFPAVIWRNFMTQALQIYSTEAAEYGPHPKHKSSSTRPALAPERVPGPRRRLPPARAPRPPGTGTTPGGWRHRHDPRGRRHRHHAGRRRDRRDRGRHRWHAGRRRRGRHRNRRQRWRRPRRRRWRRLERRLDVPRDRTKRPRQIATAGGGESPRQLDSPCDPYPPVADDLDIAPCPRPARDLDRSADQV